MAVPVAPASRSGEAGFTLLEALCAFAILSIFLGVLFSGLGDIVRGERRSQLRLRAFSQAQEILEGVGTRTPLAAGTTTGSTPDGQLNWSAVITPATADPRAVIRAYWIDVIVSPSAPAAIVPVHLSTLKPVDS